jgi:GTP-dependent dephospho-CoA kinase
LPPHVFPDHLKAKVKSPVGELIPDSKITRELLAKKAFSKKRVVVSVGDRTTERLLESKLYPNLEIIDAIEKRAKRSWIPWRGERERVLRVDNPAGTITEEALTALKQCLELIRGRPDLPARLEVSGEEDLLVLPIVAFFPTDTLVLYGQPNEGMVIVEASADHASSSRKILSEIGINSL